MKRIVAIALVLLTVASLFSCVGEQDEAEATESATKAEGAQNATENVGGIDTLAGKTPLEAHKEAKKYLDEINNYELVIDCQSELHYGETPTTYTYSTSFKKNGSDLYYEYVENGQKITYHYFTGGYLYYSNPVNKERIEVSVEEYEKNMDKPVDEVLIPVEDKCFDGIKFKKDTFNGEESYVINITLSAEDYKKYTGVTVSEDASYDVYFSKDCKLIATRIRNTQMAYGAFELNGEILNSLKNVGRTAEITPPSDAELYRIPVAFEDIDFSVLDSIDGIAESDTPTDYVKISVKDRGDIIIRLFDEVAPKSVENFKKLVSEKVYDGSIFHRVIKDFMIQGGGVAGSGDNVFGEFSSNGFTNNLAHKKGVVSLARANDPNSASSGFFIMHKDTEHLNGKYAAFGFVVYGQDVVDAIAVVETDENDKPTADVVIESVRFVNVG